MLKNLRDVKKYYDIGKNVLYPINRSITGNGTKKTLNIIKKNFPNLKIRRVSSGTKVFDWNIPPEWNVSEAYVLDKYRKKIIDFKKNNLHLMGYSIPIKKSLKKNELLKKIFTLPAQPNAIPYITSYYKKNWGFCLSEKEKNYIKKKYKSTDNFKIIIKSKLDKKGFLHYGELLLKGKSTQEILISTYICHPSMANNELSGPIVAMSLINHFQKYKNEKTIRFLFIPETIGSITYLSKNLDILKKNVIGGYNLSCIGDNRNHSCMLSKYGDKPSDFALIEAYKKLNINYKKFSFLERGSDERQYCSVGIDLPISSIFRTKYGKYKEYHTSLDDFKIVTLEGIYGGYKITKTAIEILLNKIIPKTLILCEPQMGKRGLYPLISSNSDRGIVKNYMDFLQFADGKNSIEDISKILKIDMSKTRKIYRILKKNFLVS